MTSTTGRQRVAHGALLVLLSPALVTAALLTIAVDRLGALLDPDEDEFGTREDRTELWEELPEHVTESWPTTIAAR